MVLSVDVGPDVSIVYTGAELVNTLVPSWFMLGAELVYTWCRLGRLEARPSWSGAELS